MISPNTFHESQPFQKIKSLLQHNLSYELYEKFMSLFPKDKKNYQKKNPKEINYILDTMKEHDFWGEIKGWGEKNL